MQRILIVDDNEDIREVLGTYVAKEGGEYKVVVTAIGAGSNAKSIAETSCICAQVFLEI